MITPDAKKSISVEIQSQIKMAIARTDQSTFFNENSQTRNDQPDFMPMDEFTQIVQETESMMKSYDKESKKNAIEMPIYKIIKKTDNGMRETFHDRTS